VERSERSDLEGERRMGAREREIGGGSERGGGESKKPASAATTAARPQA